MAVASWPEGLSGMMLNENEGIGKIPAVGIHRNKT